MAVFDSLTGTLLPIDEQSTVQLVTLSTEPRHMVLREANTHLCVVVPEGVHATLLVHSEGVEHLAMEVFLQSHSRLTLLCSEASKKPIIFSQATRIEEEAHLQLLNVTLGESVTHSLKSRVVGRQGVSSVDWISYARHADQQKLSVRNIFEAANGGGEVTMRAVAEEKGITDVKGMIDIGLHGGGTHTYLTQNVLMLDPTSKVDAQPALEIKTNDVKASHSASVSRVTPEDLHYFSSRGIDPSEARGLLVRGFLGELAERLDDKELQEKLIAMIAEKYQR